MKSTSKRRVRLGLGVALIAMLIGPAAVAEDKDYTPDAIGQLLTTPEVPVGVEPTLYEKYSNLSYVLDYIPVSWLELPGDGILNYWSNILMAYTQLLVRVALQLSWELATFDAYDSLGATLTASLGAAATNINKWMLPSALALGALAVFIRMGRPNGQAIDQALMVITGGLLAVTMASFPNVWVGAVTNTHSVGNQIVQDLNIYADEGQKIPFTGPTPTFTDGDPQTKHLRISADTVWRSFVVTPWCLAEFGSLKTCEDFGEEVVSRPHSLVGSEGSRQEYLSVDFAVAVGGNETDAYYFATGHAAIPRLVISGVAFLNALIFTLLMLFLSLTAIGFTILSLMLLYLGPVFVALIAMPGLPRRWGQRWLELLVLFTLMGSIVLLVQSATMSLTVTALKVSGAMGWLVSCLLSLTSVITGFILLRHLRDIFSVPHSGAGAFAGAGLLLGQLLKRAPKGKVPKGGTPSKKNPSPPAKGGAGSSPSSTPPRRVPRMSSPVPSQEVQKYRDYPHDSQPQSRAYSSRHTPRRGEIEGRRALPPGKGNPGHQSGGKHYRIIEGEVVSPAHKPQRPAPQRKSVLRRMRSYSRAGHPHLRRGPSKQPMYTPYRPSTVPPSYPTAASSKQPMYTPYRPL